MNYPQKIYNSSLDNSLNVSVTTRQKKKREDFEFVERQSEFGKTSEIGKGAFGTVRLVRDKSKGTLYAMKIVSHLFDYLDEQKADFREPLDGPNKKRNQNPKKNGPCPHPWAQILL